MDIIITSIISLVFLATGYYIGKQERPVLPKLSFPRFLTPKFKVFKRKVVKPQGTDTITELENGKDSPKE